LKLEKWIYIYRRVKKLWNGWKGSKIQNP
jgi:hypothetical protein